MENPRPSFRARTAGAFLAAILMGAPPGNAGASVTVEQGIRFFEGRLRQRGGEDPLAHLKLAQLRLDRFRITSAWPDWEASRAHLEKAFPGGAADCGYLVRTSSLRLAAHDFPAALQYALAATHAAGSDGREMAGLALFDALLASGRYDQAGELFRSMDSRRGSFPYETRRARLLELSGEWDLALEAMGRAKEDALAFAAGPSTLAWCLIQTGELEMRIGRLDKADAGYREALLIYPGHPQALEGKARIARARGADPKVVRPLFLEARASGGHLSIFLDLMELARGTGDSVGAEAWKDSLLILSRRPPDAERLHWRTLALALSESPGSGAEALRYARMDAANRPTAESMDVLARVLYRNGDVTGALRASGLSLEKRPGDPGILCRSAGIAWHAGDQARAAALHAKAVRLGRIQESRRSAPGADPSWLTEGESWADGAWCAGEIWLLHSDIH